MESLGSCSVVEKKHGIRRERTWVSLNMWAELGLCFSICKIRGLGKRCLSYLLTLKSWDTCYSMDETWRHFAKWKKPDAHGVSEWKSLSCVWLFVTPGAIWSMEFSRPEYWSGSLSLFQGIVPAQGSNPGLSHCRWILYQLSSQGSPRGKWPCIYESIHMKCPD